MDRENKLPMRVCPFCAREIPAHSLKCGYCNQWINKEPTESPLVQSAGQQFSNAQLAWHFILLSIVTFGIYEIYWFYRNWKHFKFHKGLDISPGWRTVGLFVPIYGLVLVYRQLRDIRDFSSETGIDKTYSPGGIFTGWLVLNALWQLPDPFWFVSFFSAFPLAVAQGVLNSYWQKEQPQMPARTGFSGWQIALLVIGIIMLILVLIGTFIPVPEYNG